MSNFLFIVPTDTDPVDNDVDENNLVDEEAAAEEADDDEEEAGHVNRYQRKMLTKKRKVNSIDAALDANNYNNFNIPNEQKWISGKLKSNDKNVPDTI